MNTLIMLLLILVANSFADNSKDKAKKIAEEAVILIDNGEYEKSIEMLEEARVLDPESHIYPYEIGFAYYLNNNLNKAIEVFYEVIKLKDVNDQCFTMLGNFLDMDKKPEKALEIYDLGLEKFPNSGRLHFEKGLVLESKEKYDEALELWEKGIEVNPEYPSNYYQAGLYYSSYTTEKLWGLIYAELFINIERGSKKTPEMSKLIYNTYNSCIEIKGDTIKGSFTKMNVLNLSNDGNLKKPFGLSFYMSMAAAFPFNEQVDKVNLHSINKMRINFISMWKMMKNEEDFPNVLFDWHQKLIDLGYFESYNYWLMMRGNQEEFDKWYEKNTILFDDFMVWFKSNPLKIDNDNKFYRLQYSQ